MKILLNSGADFQDFLLISPAFEFFSYFNFRDISTNKKVRKKRTVVARYTWQLFGSLGTSIAVNFFEISQNQDQSRKVRSRNSILFWKKIRFLTYKSSITSCIFIGYFHNFCKMNIFQRFRFLPSFRSIFGFCS